MKVQVHTCLDASNGLTLEVVPETEIEQAVLDAFWAHGQMGTSYSSANSLSTKGYVIQAYNQNAKAEGE